MSHPITQARPLFITTCLMINAAGAGGALASVYYAAHGVPTYLSTTATYLCFGVSIAACLVQLHKGGPLWK